MSCRSVRLALHICDSAASMAETAAEIFLRACDQAVRERGIFRVAISGGKTPIEFFRLLATPEWAEKLPWGKIFFFWVDERSVGLDHPESNYGMASRELLGHVPATHFYRIRGEQDAVEEAQRYENVIRQEFELSPGEMPRFDFILLGMGSDGHTASIFPNSPLLQERKRLVADVYVPERNADRITLTLPVINNSRICVFLVEGKEKRETLGKVLNLLDEPIFPAQLVRPEGGDLIWIVDEEAARGE